MDDDKKREDIRALLSDHLKTEAFPRADTADAVNRVVGRLQEVRGDLVRRLIIGGVTAAPVVHGDIAQACETCMYFLVHRRYCELPELDIPVEPNWSCRLWRI